MDRSNYISTVFAQDTDHAPHFCADFARRRAKSQGVMGVNGATEDQILPGWLFNSASSDIIPVEVWIGIKTSTS